MSSRSLKPFFIAVATAVICMFVLPYLEGCGEASWLPQAFVTLIGLAGASWFANRRLELLDEGNLQRKEAADEQLAAAQRRNLNDAIREADTMMSSTALSSIIAGQRWLHHLAEDDRLDPGLIRSLLCAHIVSGDPSSTAQDVDLPGGAHISVETKVRTRQAALDMLFGDPGRDRYSRCQDRPELGSCTWNSLNFTGLCIEGANFRKGDFRNARILGGSIDDSDFRETKWSGHFGGAARTSMRNVKMCGVHASSCTFENIDFRGANMGKNGLVSRYIHCIFIECNFEDARWTGAEFVNASFERCTGITFDRCKDAKLKGSSGLNVDLVAELLNKGVGGY